MIEQNEIQCPDVLIENVEEADLAYKNTKAKYNALVSCSAKMVEIAEDIKSVEKILNEISEKISSPEMKSVSASFSHDCFLGIGNIFNAIAFLHNGFETEHRRHSDIFSKLSAEFDHLSQVFYKLEGDGESGDAK